MTDKDKICDVCGNNDYYQGVASSSLGPMSHSWCAICLGMQADMKVMVESVIEGCGGIENVAAYLSYYDKEKDAYIDAKKNEIVPIKSNTGKEFQTRTEFVEYQKNLLRICECPTPHCEKSVDITEWDMVDQFPCMCCGEAFDWEEVDKKTIKFIEKTW